MTPVLKVGQDTFAIIEEPTNSLLTPFLQNVTQPFASGVWRWFKQKDLSTNRPENISVTGKLNIFELFLSNAC